MCQVRVAHWICLYTLLPIVAAQYARVLQVFETLQRYSCMPQKLAFLFRRGSVYGRQA